MKVKVSQTQQQVISVGTNQAVPNVISVGIQGPAGPNVLSGAADVDVTDLREGSVLVYNATVQKWASTTTLDAQNMEGGEF